MKKIIIIVTLLLSLPLFAKEKTYNKDITISVATLTKLELHDKALYELKKRFTEEIGTLITSSFKKEIKQSHLQLQKEIKSVLKTYASAHVKTKVLRESIDHSKYSLFVEFKADPEQSKKLLKYRIQQLKDIEFSGRIPSWFSQAYTTTQKSFGKGKGESELVALFLALGDYTLFSTTGKDSLESRPKKPKTRSYKQNIIHYLGVKNAIMQYHFKHTKWDEPITEMEAYIRITPSHTLHLVNKNMLKKTGYTIAQFLGTGMTYAELLSQVRQKLLQSNLEIKFAVVENEGIKQWYCLVTGPRKHKKVSGYREEFM